MTGNVVQEFGMGVPTLTGGSGAQVPRFVPIAVTALSALGAALAVLTLVTPARQWWLGHLSEVRPWHLVLLSGVGILNFGPAAFSYYIFFDRYLLIFLPLLLGSIVAAGAGRWKAFGPSCTVISVVVLAAYLAFGVAATHDYLEWNRVRWVAAADLERRLNLAPSEVDGGWEYNCLYECRERVQTGRLHQPGATGLVDGSDRQARLAFRPLPRHEIVSHRDCAHWLPWGESRIYLLCVTDGAGLREAGSTK
jgi:hypothetical protein